MCETVKYWVTVAAIMGLGSSDGGRAEMTVVGDRGITACNDVLEAEPEPTRCDSSAVNVARGLVSMTNVCAWDGIRWMLEDGDAEMNKSVAVELT